MNNYTDYLIDDKQAKSRAKSKETKRVLVAMIFEKIGYHAPLKLSMGELRGILNQ